MTWKKLLQRSRPKLGTLEASKELAAIKRLEQEGLLAAILDDIEADWVRLLKQSYFEKNTANRDYYAAGLAVVDNIRVEIGKRLSRHQNYAKKENIGNE